MVEVGGIPVGLGTMLDGGERCNDNRFREMKEKVVIRGGNF